jgi:2-oxoglutarate dehydrogenase E2 component (dihydrolipoamide succinyltransferase)
MPIPLKVPSLGESVTQATIGAWLKKEGDPVQADEPIVEVESEKATVALPAPVAGVLRRVLRQTGDTVAVGEVVGEIEEGAAAQAEVVSPAGTGPTPGGVVPARGNGAAKGGPRPATPSPSPASAPAAAVRPERSSEAEASERSRRAPTSTDRAAKPKPARPQRTPAAPDTHLDDPYGGGPLKDPYR